MYVLLLFRTNTVIANSLSQSRYICTIYWSWWYLLCLFYAFVALCACESAQQHASVINTRSIINNDTPDAGHARASCCDFVSKASSRCDDQQAPSAPFSINLLPFCCCQDNSTKALHAGTHKLSTRQRTWRADRQHLTTHGLQSFNSTPHLTTPRC